ncbi:MAG: sigma-70 family RNA polymerase sigma factor [Tissierellia bacterium]|nr:sigma-70 family RNA polymerase sigma factor [Tissierellia bacterium]
MNDKNIITALVLDEEYGYDMMIKKYTAYVSSIVYQMTKEILSYPEMEELVADVFYKVWLKRNTLRGDSLKGLIGQITRNACIDVYRKQRTDFLPLKEDIIITNADIVYESIEKNELKKLITSIVENFIEPDRELFIRYYYFGEKLNAIAAKLNLNPSTAKTKLSRSREKLREILNERWYNNEQK